MDNTVPVPDLVVFIIHKGKQRGRPELLPDFEPAVKEAVVNPDSVRKSARFQNARLFTKFFENIRGGKYTVVVVVSDTKPEQRDWIITAYITRKLSDGEIEWEKK
ncbi:MAG TPA: hypothetical protein PK514_11650 [Spirochaetota bacterium]|nr:hypothetical protein [Spirochaetota bacterium]